MMRHNTNEVHLNEKYIKKKKIDKKTFIINLDS